MRVSRSAMGSVCIVGLLPGALRHSGDHALMGQLAQADAAEAELAEDGARTAAAAAAGVLAHAEPLRARLRDDERPLGHALSYSLLSVANGRPSARRSAR